MTLNESWSPDTLPLDPPAAVLVELTDPPDRIGSYQICAKLGEGGMGVVYKARSPSTGEFVAIKRVKALAPSLMGSLRREIHALRRISHPGIVRVLDQGSGGGVPWYAMELVEGETLDARIRAFHAARAGVPVEFRGLMPLLRIIRRLCETLAFLHGEGCVHRDLTPRNVVIRADEVPVLVDFGLASLSADPGRETVHAVLERGGTPWYMAPEQLANELVDARADLFALGCILYETLTGEIPFPREGFVSTRGSLRAAPVLSQAPPPSPSHRVADLPPELDVVTLRLLAARPEDRIGYARDVVRVLERVGVTDPAPLAPPRSRSYSYRPALVGSDAFLQTFAQMLDRCRAGTGGRIFVAGESGGGKTRSVLEAAARARRQDVTVVTAGCAALSPSSDAGDAAFSGGVLHAFRPLLLAIADACRAGGRALTSSVLGDRAKILAACEPELATLADQANLPDPPELPAAAARVRLLTALEATLGAFAGGAPLLLVLDDLQWADDLSVAFLESLGPAFFEQHPVLILGTYRSEEAAPEMQRGLVAMADRHHEIGRLDEASVGQMVGDMLALRDPPPNLVAFLARHSEGNPLFITEYLRTAVDEGWLTRDDTGAWRIATRGGHALSRDEGLPIPASLKSLLERHIDRLSPPSRDLVSFAAVLGRTFDPRLLAAAPRPSSSDILDFVDEAMTCQILESAGPARVRFVHDKIRETAYGLIPPAHLPDLHRAAARALEQVLAPDEVATVDHAVALAHHWRIAGDPARELPHRRAAAERALSLGSYREAILHLERALALVHSGDEVAAAAPLVRALGQAYLQLGDVSSSRKVMALGETPVPSTSTSTSASATPAPAVVGIVLRRAAAVLVRGVTVPLRWARRVGPAPRTPGKRRRPR